MNRWIAIDFGTTNSAVAYYGPRGPEVIKVDGQELVPSVVTIIDQDVRVGLSAVRLRNRHSRHTYSSFKRNMAVKFNPDEATDDQMAPGPDGMLHYVGPHGHTYSPVELASFVMMKLKRTAEEKLKTTVKSVILTAPATYTIPQRAAIREAAEMAGFEDIHIKDEPTMAALAHGYDADHASTLAVIDIGGGTTDGAILVTGRGLVTVMATNGTPFVGGDDWDRQIRNLIVNLHEVENEDSLLATRTDALRKLLVEAEQVKRRLTDEPATEFRVEDIDINKKTGNDVHAIYPVSRDLMDQVTSDQLTDIRAAMDRMLAEARVKDPKFTVRDIDRVILVGGQTRVKAVQRLVAEIFGQEPTTERDPETAVVLGAAIQAGLNEGQKGDLTIRNITSHRFSVETHDRAADVATEIAHKGIAYGSRMTWWLSNRDDGQEMMTLRLMEGDSPVPGECALLWEHQIRIAGDGAEPLPVQMDVEIGPSGELWVDVAGVSYGRAT